MAALWGYPEVTKESQKAQMAKLGGSPTKGGGDVEMRPMTEDEREVIRREMRDEIEANGEERDATEEEIDAEITKRLEKMKMSKQSMQRVFRTANKPIVNGLEKLKESSAKSITVLEGHERSLSLVLGSLMEIIDNLTIHKDMRDSLFDPLLSTDLPFARRMGTKKIERSVLYQKMNFVPKNKDGSDMKCEWNDKDQEATEGKIGTILDAKGRPGLTAHESTFCAAEREDAARAACNAALKAVRDAQSQLALRKSQLQVAVLDSRKAVLKGKRAAKTGKFGSGEERNTDPSTRKMAANPEDAGG